MMKEFSTRTIEGLRRHKIFKLILPAFTSFLEINVNKEVEKDKQIILCAFELKTQGRPPTDEDTAGLLQKSREIDRKFLQDISTLAASIDIRYEVIEQYRSRRIRKILEEVYRVLIAWDSIRGFRTVIISLYTHDQLVQFLREIFTLYINETRTLSESVKIPRKLLIVRNTLFQRVGTIMEQVADDLATELAGVVFSAKQTRIY